MVGEAIRTATASREVGRVGYIESCLSGQIVIPDYAEVKPVWGLFVDTMLVMWLKISVPRHKRARAVAERWARIFVEAFAAGNFDQSIYEQVYRAILHSQGKKVHYF